MGFFSTLIIGSFMSILGMYTKSVTPFDQVKYIVSAVSPFAIGIAIGMKANKTHLQSFAIGLACLIVARSNIIVTIDGTTGHLNFTPPLNSDNFGFNFTNMRLSGDVFSAWLAGVSVLYVIAIFEWESSFDFLLVPLIGILIGFIEGFFLAYIVSIFLRGIEWIIWQSSHQGEALTIALSPIIGLLMGVSLSLPTSSAAMAMALNLQGDAAIAAIAGTSAQMLTFGVMTWWSSRNLTKTIAVGVGTSMLLMPNYSRRPILLLLPCINSVICALVAVAIFHGKLPFPLDGIEDKVSGTVSFSGKTTSGMGTVALYGQIFTLNDNGWGNYLAWLNVVFIQIILPVAIATLGIFILSKYKLLKKDWLSLWEEKDVVVTDGDGKTLATTVDEKPTNDIVVIDGDGKSFAISENDKTTNDLVIIDKNNGNALSISTNTDTLKQQSVKAKKKVLKTKSKK